jgi:hypothetical protein
MKHHGSHKIDPVAMAALIIVTAAAVVDDREIETGLAVPPAIVFPVHKCATFVSASVSIGIGQRAGIKPNNIGHESGNNMPRSRPWAIRSVVGRPQVRI